MPNLLRFVIIGGDLRQIYLAQQLVRDGRSVLLYAVDGSLCPELPVCEAFPTIQPYDCIVLPLPAIKEEHVINTPLSNLTITAERLFESLSPGQIVLAGKTSERVRSLAKEKSIQLIDYFDREDLAIQNAVPTAEGAMALAMDELPITLHRMKTLVIGFGRIGKILAHRLQSMGCSVTVSARKYSDFAWIDAYGYQGTDTNALGENLSSFDLIFNTVPSLILNRDKLKRLKKNCLVIDLASKPGGVDFESAKELGIGVIWALSLPGKCSPHTSGIIIRNTLYNILSEMGVLDNDPA